MQTYIFTIASHYASALINGDYSGLEDNEEKELNDFLAYLEREYGTNNLVLTDYYAINEADFNRDDVTNLWANCLQFNLEVNA
jgi:hypothetical protein